jgi:rhamnulokinase
MLGGFGDGQPRLREVHRFEYAPRRREGHLRWDFLRLEEGLHAGLLRAREAAAAEDARLDSVGVDSWGVDYGLLDGAGRMLEEPICYRDCRTDGEMERVFARVPREEIFRRTGIQFLQLNTLYQLAAHVREGLSPRAHRLLMVPDLCHHLLCGSVSGERTNASTTQLLNARAAAWDDELFSSLGLPRRLMPELVAAGTALGRLTPELCSELGLEALEVIAPATHDTASAVAGIPLAPGWAYISSGTWSLVGVERDAPLLDPAVLEANFTNEAGAFGTVRFLENVMGLWLLESCRKEWGVSDLDALLHAADQIAGFAGFVFPDAPRFFHPDSMVRELRTSLAETGQAAPEDRASLTKVILDSLALRYASVVRTIERLIGCDVPGIHVVGGGSQNDYLNQATANAAGRPVLAGPVEATAIGNLLVQSIARGEVESLAEGRRLVGQAVPLRRFSPKDAAAWEEAARRYQAVEAAVSGSSRSA